MVSPVAPVSRREFCFALLRQAHDDVSKALLRLVIVGWAECDVEELIPLFSPTFFICDGYYVCSFKTSAKRSFTLVQLSLLWLMALGH